MDLARDLASDRKGVRICLAVAASVETPPNLDFGLVALASALGLPQGAAAGLFAVGRCAGWVAHVLEQYQAGYLVRPRARYTGWTGAVEHSLR
jgi:citrate synthase